MPKQRLILHKGEGLVLRTWPFHEADLLVSLLTREQGVVKGVARHAMRSRRRFGGALEPGTHVLAQYAERPREDLVRLDSFEIVWSPLKADVNLLRVAGLQLVLEVLEQALPEGAPEDNVFRLALAALRGMEGQEKESREEESGGAGGGVWLAVTYFCVWMCRLMGWWPELVHCGVCGLDLRGETVWWSSAADGVTCGEDRRPHGHEISPNSVAESYAMLRTSLGQMQQEDAWPRERTVELRRFAVAVLERHLDRRLRSASCLM